MNTIWTICLLAVLIQLVGMATSQSPTVTHVYAGQGAILKCKTNQPDVNAVYQWEKPLENVISNDFQHRIPEVTAEDVGTYFCRIKTRVNGQEVEEVDSIQLQLKDDPRLSAAMLDAVNSPTLVFQPPIPEGGVTVSPGDYHYQSCRVSGINEDYTYRWTGPKGDVATRNFFYIESIDASDMGIYTCYARGPDGYELRESIPLTVKSDDDAGFSFVEPYLQLDGDDRMQFGGYVFQNCKLMNGDERNWKFMWRNPLNVKVSNSKRLYFQLNDTIKQGDYTCVAENLRTNEILTKTHSVRFVVPDFDNVVDSTIFVSIRTNPSVPLISQPFTLTCMSQPSSIDVRYQWFRNEQLISNNKEYIINNVRPDDLRSTFKCSASRGNNVAEASYSVQMTYYRNNELSMQPAPGQQIFVREGVSKELHCELNVDFGASRPSGSDVAWYLNGQPFYITDWPNVERLDQIRVSILVLTNIQPQNEGHYECVIRGTRQEGFVVVVPRAVGLEMSESTETVNEGAVNAVKFQCRVVDIPGVINSQLVWDFVNEAGQRRSLHSGWQRTDSATNLKTSFLLLQTPVAISDQGIYTCTEPNGHSVSSTLSVVRGRSAKTIVRISPPSIVVRPFQSVTLECTGTVNGNREGMPVFEYADGRPISSDSRFREQYMQTGTSTLTLHDLTEADNNLQIRCGMHGVYDKATIFVEQLCNINSFRCANSQCIDSSRKCDDVKDCADGSDEDPLECVRCDPMERRCEIYNGNPPLKSIYSANWECDGEDDCGNGFDEKDCRYTGSQCGGTHFKCLDNRDIPRAFMCDKEPDCPQGEDENGCFVTPQIMSEVLGQDIKRVRQGETVRLTCTAQGKPLPKIIWRYNWRCLPDESRMTVETIVNGCRNVISTLTITATRPGDDAIYNCEALSGDQRVISNDYQVILIVP